MFNNNKGLVLEPRAINIFPSSVMVIISEELLTFVIIIPRSLIINAIVKALFPMPDLSGLIVFVCIIYINNCFHTSDCVSLVDLDPDCTMG